MKLKEVTINADNYRAERCRGGGFFRAEYRLARAVMDIAGERCCVRCRFAVFMFPSARNMKNRRGFIFFC